MSSQVSTGTYVRLIADDCLVYCEIHTIQDQEVLPGDLVKLHRWAECWGTRFNPNKCYIVHIRWSQTSIEFYELCSVILQSIKSAKYLGITIRHDLHWGDRINSVATEGNRTLHFIHRNLEYCPRSTRKMAFCSLARSSLEYSETCL